jgi:hypothetical protein
MAVNPDQSTNSKHSAPADVCLLLRAHAEARWLTHKVLPVLREFEQSPSRSEDQLGPGLAYLEVLWIEACGRAAETDAARVELDDRGGSGDRSLYEKAHRYHSAVRRLRNAVARRIARLLAIPREASAWRPSASDRSIRDRPANS